MLYPLCLYCRKDTPRTGVQAHRVYRRLQHSDLNQIHGCKFGTKIVSLAVLHHQTNQPQQYDEVGSLLHYQRISEYEDRREQYRPPRVCCNESFPYKLLLFSKILFQNPTCNLSRKRSQEPKTASDCAILHSNKHPSPASKSRI